MSTKHSIEQPGKKQGIYGKILAVQKAIDSVPKRGFNAFHKYSYATEADILTVKEILNAHGLIILPTTLKKETGFKPDGKSWASVTLLFRVVDSDSGEMVESQFSGYAEDNFDKAIYKATTGANKYFYLKFFGIATEDDPEREEPPQGRQSVKSPSSSQAAASLAQRPAAHGRDEIPAERKPETVEVDPGKRSLALIHANKILTLQKQYTLSNEEVLRFGEIPSVKDLAEEGQAELLAAAYQKLSRHVQLQMTP